MHSNNPFLSRQQIVLLILSLTCSPAKHILPVIGHLPQGSDSAHIEVEQSSQGQEGCQGRVQEDAVDLVVKRIGSKVGRNEFNDVAGLSHDDPVESPRSGTNTAKHCCRNANAVKLC